MNRSLPTFVLTSLIVAAEGLQTLTPDGNRWQVPANPFARKSADRRVTATSLQSDFFGHPSFVQDMPGGGYGPPPAGPGGSRVGSPPPYGGQPSFIDVSAKTEKQTHEINENPEHERTRYQRTKEDYSRPNRSQSPSGTPSYSTPHHAMGNPGDFRTDNSPSSSFRPRNPSSSFRPQQEARQPSTTTSYSARTQGVNRGSYGGQATSVNQRTSPSTSYQQRQQEAQGYPFGASAGPSRPRTAHRVYSRDRRPDSFDQFDAYGGRPSASYPSRQPYGAGPRDPYQRRDSFDGRPSDSFYRRDGFDRRPSDSYYRQGPFEGRPSDSYFERQESFRGGPGDSFARRDAFNGRPGDAYQRRDDFRGPPNDPYMDGPGREQGGQRFSFNRRPTTSYQQTPLTPNQF